LSIPAGQTAKITNSDFTNLILQEALAAYGAGLHIVPTKMDGSKAPFISEMTPEELESEVGAEIADEILKSATIKGDKIFTWSHHRYKQASIKQINEWYTPRQGMQTGLAVVTGAAGIEGFEFETVEAYELFKEQAKEWGLSDLIELVSAGYEDSTPGGGIHWLYFCDAVLEQKIGNVQLASLSDADGKLKISIETRGYGGYYICNPSYGRVHDTGKPYIRNRGGFDSILTLTADERDQLHSIARSLNQKPPVKSVYSPKSSTGNSPGDVFNEQGIWSDILEPSGWTLARGGGNVDYWRRPDKTAGHSATVGSTAELQDKLYVFSSNAAPLEADISYDKFGAYAWLNHGGDFSAAAKELAAQGYKDRTYPRATVTETPEPVADEVFYGPVGKFVKAVASETEADPIGIYATILAGIGNMAGRGPHWIATTTYHPMLIYPLLIGNTASGAKGDANSIAQYVLREVDLATDPQQRWTNLHNRNGLSTGEGLIHRVRDPKVKIVPAEDTGDDNFKGPTEEIVDAGVTDKRLFVVEPEFSRLLQASKREGNTLSEIIRQAYDGGNLEIMTKTSPMRATDPHISIAGHITPAELKKRLTDTDATSGFANRFTPLYVERQRALPEGGDIEKPEIQHALGEVIEAYKLAQRKYTAGYEFKRDAEAREYWHDLYHELIEQSEQRGEGLLGAMTQRAAPQIMRIANVLAYMDVSDVITRPHLEAAYAMQQYSVETVRSLYGTDTGDQAADELLNVMSNRDMTRTEISKHFGRNKSKQEIDTILKRFADMRLIQQKEPEAGTKGRTAVVWKFIG